MSLYLLVSRGAAGGGGGGSRDIYEVRAFLQLFKQTLRVAVKHLEQKNTFISYDNMYTNTK